MGADLVLFLGSSIVGHISLPDLIVPDDLQISQKVWINTMLVIAFGEIRSGIDYSNPHDLHMVLYGLSVDANPFAPEQISDAARPGRWQEGVNFINPASQEQCQF